MTDKMIHLDPKVAPLKDALALLQTYFQSYLYNHIFNRMGYIIIEYYRHVGLLWQSFFVIRLANSPVEGTKIWVLSKNEATQKSMT